MWSWNNTKYYIIPEFNLATLFDYSIPFALIYLLFYKNHSILSKYLNFLSFYQNEYILKYRIHYKTLKLNSLQLYQLHFFGYHIRLIFLNKLLFLLFFHLSILFLFELLDPRVSKIGLLIWILFLISFCFSTILNDN